MFNYPLNVYDRTERKVAWMTLYTYAGNRLKRLKTTIRHVCEREVERTIVLEVR